jgi:hypothetical protein
VGAASALQSSSSAGSQENSQNAAAFELQHNSGAAFTAAAASLISATTPELRVSFESSAVSTSAFNFQCFDSSNDDGAARRQLGVVPVRQHSVSATYGIQLVPAIQPPASAKTAMRRCTATSAAASSCCSFIHHWQRDTTSSPSISASTQQHLLIGPASRLTIQQRQPLAATSAVPERHLRGKLATPPSVLATSSHLHPQGRNQLQRCVAMWLAYIICSAARRAPTLAQHRRQLCARHLQQKHLQRYISRLSFRTFKNSSSGAQRLWQPLDASSSASAPHLCLNSTCAFGQFSPTRRRHQLFSSSTVTSTTCC